MLLEWFHLISLEPRVSKVETLTSLHKFSYKVHFGLINREFPVELRIFARMRK